MNERLFVYEHMLYKIHLGRLTDAITEPEYWPQIAPEDFVPVPENVEAFANQFRQDAQTALFAIQNEITKMLAFVENLSIDAEEISSVVQQRGSAALRQMLLMSENFTYMSPNNFDYYWKKYEQDTYVRGVGRITGLQAMQILKLPQANFDGLEKALKQYKNVTSAILNRLGDRFMVTNSRFFRKMADGSQSVYVPSDWTRQKIYEKILEIAMVILTRNEIRPTMRSLFPTVRPPGPLPTE